MDKLTIFSKYLDKIKDFDIDERYLFDYDEISNSSDAVNESYYGDEYYNEYQFTFFTVDGYEINCIFTYDVETEKYRSYDKGRSVHILTSLNYKPHMRSMYKPSEISKVLNIANSTKLVDIVIYDTLYHINGEDVTTQTLERVNRQTILRFILDE